ncbi:PilZ domain-containing protein [Desulfobulbus alkaliphilus]|uniref:PilZ domain-containing protein n=1 Tax=Desulfobulbus alkaliphilus TaxID=869814 RepID=UPI001963B12C|nr:PilZ domain-containing protein [Desulfobulbus alkaliphilus]MBM9538759.1 PilZ domain-containing protein [Desulfobulbus alkaliphilus]
MYADQLEEAEQKLETTKRRNGIRFKLYGPSIEYSMNDQKYRGTIIDLSISGCSVEVKETVPALAQELTILLLFDTHDRHPSHFQIKTRVVRATTSAFAVQFLDLDSDRQEQLYQRLIHEVGRTVDFPQPT